MTPGPRLLLDSELRGRGPWQGSTMHHQDHQVGIDMCNEVENDTRPNRCHKCNQECRHSGVRHQTDYWRLPRTNEYTKADYRIVRASAIRLPLCMRVLVHGRRLALILSAALPARRGSPPTVPCHYEL